MDVQIVVMPGSNAVDLPVLLAAAAEYGWAVHIARSVSELRGARERANIGAVLFQLDSVKAGGDWLETISLLKEAAPGVKLVGCAEFSQMPDYPKLCREGLFHAIWLPLKRSEVRQCFGFLCGAERGLSAVPQRARAVG
jgi:DNA-binding NtrC family response regulator